MKFGVILFLLLLITAISYSYVIITDLDTIVTNTVFGDSTGLLISEIFLACVILSSMAISDRYHIFHSVQGFSKSASGCLNVGVSDEMEYVLHETK